MTGIAGLRIIDVSANSTMILISIAPAMASSAAKDFIIVWIGMAFGTVETGMHSGSDWKIGMDKGALTPARV